MLDVFQYQSLHCYIHTIFLVKTKHFSSQLIIFLTSLYFIHPKVTAFVVTLLHCDLFWLFGQFV